VEGGPVVTDSQGIPWSGSYVNANGDLSVDLRSNMGAESRAKIVYEYLMKFTDDAYVKDTLMFLMTREVAHFQMFEAALDTIQPNFPPGVLQSDPRYSNKYFNMSNGLEVKGPWNEGKSMEMGETWQYIKDPLKHVVETQGLINSEPVGTNRTEESVEEKEATLSKIRSMEVNVATPKTDIKWSKYPEK
jgi:Mn-containing catalase